MRPAEREGIIACLDEAVLGYVVEHRQPPMLRACAGRCCSGYGNRDGGLQAPLGRQGGGRRCPGLLGTPRRMCALTIPSAPVPAQMMAADARTIVEQRSRHHHRVFEHAAPRSFRNRLLASKYSREITACDWQPTRPGGCSRPEQSRHTFKDERMIQSHGSPDLAPRHSETSRPRAKSHSAHTGRYWAPVQTAIAEAIGTITWRDRMSAVERPADGRQSFL